MSSRHAEGQREAHRVEGRDQNVGGPDAEYGGELRAGECAHYAGAIGGGAGQAHGAHQVLRGNRFADERVPEHEIVGADETGDRRDGEHPKRRQATAQAQDREDQCQDDVDRAHREQHRPAAEPVAQHPVHRREESAQEQQRAERGEQEHRAGLHHHVPAQDDRLHLERERCEEVGGPLEAEAADAEGGQGQGMSVSSPASIARRRVRLASSPRIPYDPPAVNFDFSPDQRSLREQARKFLAEHASSTCVRRILEGAAPYDAELWRGMAEMGWMGTAIPETHGGAGFGYLELCVLAEELGRSLAPTPFSSTIYLASEALLLAGSPAQQKRWLPRIAQGQAIGCFALAEGPQVATPGNITTRVDGGRVSGTKIPVTDGDVADFAIVVAGEADVGRAGLFLVDLTGPGVTRTSIT